MADGALYHALKPISFNELLIIYVIKTMGKSALDLCQNFHISGVLQHAFMSKYKNE